MITTLLLAGSSSLPLQKPGVNLGIKAYRPLVSVASGPCPAVATGYGIVIGLASIFRPARQVQARPSQDILFRRQRSYNTKFLDLSVPVVWTPASGTKPGWLAGVGPTPISSLRLFQLDPGLGALQDSVWRSGESAQYHQLPGPDSGTRRNRERQAGSVGHQLFFVNQWCTVFKATPRSSSQAPLI